ncbi:Pyocin activator protein PrtN [Methylophilaceae bacterium 11]|nr:Pyocin activator protein PrtN [Methylophilaceae bacterium 11]
MQNISSTIQILLARFNGQVLIPLVPASESVGIPAQTARNKLSNGTFPIPTVMIDSRRFIHISDLADFVDSRRASPAIMPEPNKNRRGARTKEVRMQEQGRV